MADPNEDENYTLPEIGDLYTSIWETVMDYFGHDDALSTSQEIEETIRNLAYVLTDLMGDLEKSSITDVADIFNFYLSEAIKSKTGVGPMPSDDDDIAEDPTWAKSVDMGKLPN